MADAEQKVSGVFRSTLVVGLCTGASRLLGLVRDVLMAVLFGTSLAKSAFDVAFLVPNLFRRLFGEGALSAAFVPVFSERLQQGGRDEANRLAGRIAGLLATGLTVIVVGGIAAATFALHLVPLGPKAMAVLPLLRIMLPYMLFICLVGLCMGMLNSVRHFAVPALSPVLLNVVWILTLVVICPRFGDTPAERIRGAAWGILVAGILQLAVQVPVLLRLGVRPRLSLDWRDRQVRRVLLLMAPAAVGMGVFQLNVLVDRLLALWVAEWAPAALTYAERLVYLPLGVFATALGTVLLPAFSHQAARGEPDEMRSTLDRCIRNLLLVTVPAAVGLLVLAEPIVRVLFVWGGGKFDAASAVQTARALRFYAPGLVVFGLYKILAPAFYAMKDTRTPVRIGLVALVLNLVLNVTFILTWPEGYRHAGLAMATVLASAVNCTLLSLVLRKRIGRLAWGAAGLRLACIVPCAAAMGVAAVWIQGELLGHLMARGMGPKGAEVVALLAAVGGGAALYAVLCAIPCRGELAAMFRRDAGGSPPPR